MSNIVYPYIPEGRVHKYVGMDNEWMRWARNLAERYAIEPAMPNASVVVRDGQMLGWGANGSKFHDEHGCERKRRGCKTGEGYELCEGCHPKNHSEPKVIAAARANGHGDLLRGADVYLWGHWWCCKPCWDTMTEAGINDVYLLEGSERLFNMQHPENVVGRQFTYDR